MSSSTVRATIHDVVAEHHDERVVAHVLAGHRHRVAETERFALAHVVDVGHLGQGLDLAQVVGLALLLQVVLELEVAIEVVLERALAAPGDDQDVVDAGPHGLLDDVLDGRLVDDRQHLLRLGLGGRQEPGAEPGRRDDRLCDLTLGHGAHRRRDASDGPGWLLAACRRYPWHSPFASASPDALGGAERCPHTVPLQGLRERTRGRAGLPRRPADRVPVVRRNPAQEVRIRGDQLQGQRLLQERQSRRFGHEEPRAGQHEQRAADVDLVLE